MATILLTGFEPFGGEQINPSWQAVSRLGGHTLRDGSSVHVAQLPCAFGSSMALLEQLIARVQPEIVVCVGQAGGRSEISVERVAINIDDARIPDNAGAQPIDCAIAVDGPAAYFSTLPIKAIVQRLSEKGIPAAVSQSAGTYVCNHVFYGLMNALKRHPSVQRAGFVHIPYLPEQAVAQAGAPSMSLELMVRGLLILLETTQATGIDSRISGGATH